jgi:UDP-N-acetylglucosamine transferase subunit ALG13
MMSEADVVVSHAGVGTIATALTLNKPLLVLPRRGAFGEHVNDHQVGTARRYAELGHVLLAETEDDLPRMLAQLSTFKPKPRIVNAKGIATRIDHFLREGI